MYKLQFCTFISSVTATPFKYYMTVTSNITTTEYRKCLQISFFRYYLIFFTSLFSESRLAIRPCPHPVTQSGHKNVDFGIRPRVVRLLAGVFCSVRKISKIGATRRHILRPTRTKFDFRWGSAPHPTGGAYSAPPYPCI